MPRREDDVNGASSGSTSADLAETRRSTTADLEVAVSLLRRAVHDTGHTLESLAAHFHAHGVASDRAYIHRVLHQDKALSYKFVVALPEDVQARFEQLRAEQFGFVVTPRLASHEDAVRALVSGLVGVLATSALPRKADRLARVTSLPVDRAKVWSA